MSPIGKNDRNGANVSLALEVDDVTEVLLGDGWHSVSGESFIIDSFEFVWGDELVHGGGQSDVCAAGFRFNVCDDDGRITTMAGPLTAILAVSTEPSR